MAEATYGGSLTSPWTSRHALLLNSGEGGGDDREGGSVDDDGQGEVRYTRCVKFGRKECLKGKALMRGMGLKTNKLVVSKYSMHGEGRKKCL